MCARNSPGHESANLGPSALCNEKTDNRVSHCTPGFTSEQHHGGLEGVDLQSRTATDRIKNTCRHKTHVLPINSYVGATHTFSFSLHYLSDIEQVDLQEEGCGAGSHLLGRAANGETQLTA